MNLACASVVACADVVVAEAYALIVGSATPGIRLTLAGRKHTPTIKYRSHESTDPGPTSGYKYKPI